MTPLRGGAASGGRPLALALGALLWASVAQAESGRTGANTLLRNVAAGPAAMGQAFTSVRGELDTIGFNPAGLADLNDSAVNATYFNGLVDNSFGAVNYGHRLGFGSLFAGGNYFDAGDIEINTSAGEQSTVKAQQDMVGLVGVAVGRDWPVSIGVAGKFYRLELAETADTTGSAFDIGAQWKTPVHGLTLGGAAQHMGSDVKFENESDPLPTTQRVGVSYLLDLQGMKKKKRFPYTFLFAVDAVSTKEEDDSINGGFEVRRELEFLDQVGWAALRGGYLSDAESPTAGFGVQVQDFRLDYGISFLDDLDETHRVTVGWRFAHDRADNKSRNRKVLTP